MKNLSLYIITISFWLLPAHAGQGMSTQQSLPTALVQLAQQLNMPTISNWQEAKNTFSRWGRISGQERWELPSIQMNNSQLKKVNESLSALGFINAVPAKEKNYDYAVILGGTVPSMISRLNYLIEQWKTGVRFTQIIFLTGQRPLSNLVDHFETSLYNWAPDTKKLLWSERTLPLDESEAAQLIYAFASLPSGLKKVPVFYNSTPRKWLAHNHQWQRANTAMTIHSWLKEQKPSPGKTLVVSNQPNMHYQHQVFIHNIPSTFTIETIAPACHLSTSMAIKLDAVWLWIKNQ